MDTENKALAKISAGRQELALANDIQIILTLRDVAAASQLFANAQGFKEAAQEAKIFQLQAERKAGEWLRENINHSGGGDRKSELQDATAIQDLPEGVDKYESKRWQLEAALPEEKFNEWIDDCLATGKEISASALRNIAIKEKRTQDHESKREVGELDIDGSILLGDMREIGNRIPDNSIDLILTDPPYLSEFIPLFSDLSRFAERVLRPGGLCLTYSGQIHLPEIYTRMGECLEYLWTFAIRHTGGAQRIFKANVNTAWKPILAYVKPPLSIYWDAFIDVTSGGVEKDLHEWQQSEGEAAYFIQNLCPQKGIVLDPFCGSGTVLSAAKKLNRQYIGIEIDEQTAGVASRRLQ